MTQLLANVDSAPADAFRAPTLGSHVGHSDEPLSPVELLEAAQKDGKGGLCRVYAYCAGSEGESELDAAVGTMSSVVAEGWEARWASEATLELQGPFAASAAAGIWLREPVVRGRGVAQSENGGHPFGSLKQLEPGQG